MEVLVVAGTVRLQSMVNANGRLYGQITEWPDDEATWTRVALGVLRVPDEPDIEDDEDDEDDEDGVAAWADFTVAVDPPAGDDDGVMLP